MIIVIALSARIIWAFSPAASHVTWALAAGGTAGSRKRPRYNKTRCFEPFPFPDASDDQKARIRVLAEELDAHRKRRQAEHPEAGPDRHVQRAGKAAGRRAVDRQGQDGPRAGAGLRACVSCTTIWMPPWARRTAGRPRSTAEEILERLVALNATGAAAEEAQGPVRWLRPPSTRRPPSHGIRRYAIRPDSRRRPPLQSLPRNTPPPALARPHGRAGAGGASCADCAGQAAARDPRSPRPSADAPRRPRRAELLETLVTLGQRAALADERYAAG